MAHYDGSTALTFSMHSHLLAALVWRYEQGLTPSVEPILRKIADEELILVSTGGRDWLNGSGTAEKVDGGYKISGRKFFSSGLGRQKRATISKLRTALALRAPKPPKGRTKKKAKIGKMKKRKKLLQKKVNIMKMMKILLMKIQK